jgi:hypothetical protein
MSYILTGKEAGGASRHTVCQGDGTIDLITEAQNRAGSFHDHVTRYTKVYSSCTLHIAFLECVGHDSQSTLMSES